MALGEGGLFWALLPAIIRLSLGDRLINVAFLQLTSKVTRIVGTQPLLFATAPEEGNGHIISLPQRLFSLFPPHFLHPYCTEISDCVFIALLDPTLLSKLNLSTTAFSFSPLPEYFAHFQPVHANLKCNRKQKNEMLFMLLHGERKGWEMPCKEILQHPLKSGNTNAL